MKDATQGYVETQKVWIFEVQSLTPFIRAIIDRLKNDISKYSSLGTSIYKSRLDVFA